MAVSSTLSPSPPQDGSSSPNERRGSNASNGSEGENGESEEGSVRLYKSSRLKGYITLVLASVINYSAALDSDPARLHANATPSSGTQRRYSQAVALVSGVLSLLSIIPHLDRYSPLRKLWVKLFKSKSTFELSIIGFLLVWWFVATVIQTSVRGIAGDGKDQFNLYYSTWCCCMVSFWMLERWWVNYGWSSFREFIASWPYRAPGWIATFVSAFFTLVWYLDLFLNADKNKNIELAEFYQDIPESQWQWLLFVAAFTMVPSAVFVLAEIFRESKPDGEIVVKGPWENILEAFLSFLLVLAWIPSVIIATTPGGAASLVGNAYFCTWGTTVFVMETFLWIIHDFRGGVFDQLKQKEQEYKKKQQEVLEESRRIQRESAIATTRRRFNSDDFISSRYADDPSVFTSQLDDSNHPTPKSLTIETSRTPVSSERGDSEFFDAVEFDAEEFDYGGDDE